MRVSRFLIFRYITVPALAGFFFSLFILVSIILICIENGCTQFNFTLLYQNPLGTPLERHAYRFFMKGFIGVMIAIAMALHTEHFFLLYGHHLPKENIGWFQRLERELIYLTGLLTILFACLILVFVGGHAAHDYFAVAAFLATILHVFARSLRVWWFAIAGVLGVIFAILAYVFVFWSFNSFLFSLFQVLAGLILLYGILLHIAITPFTGLYSSLNIRTETSPGSKRYTDEYKWEKWF